MTISHDDAVTLLSELIAIPSVNPDFRREGDPDHWFSELRLAQFVRGWLSAIGLDTELDEALPDRPNVIARLLGKPGGKRMLWEGHLDTVQASGMAIDPFRPVLRDGYLFGRGAVDDKGCLAAFMLALRSLLADPPGCSVTFVAAIDEEYQFRGIRHHLARGERYDLGIAGEPTGLRIVSACKGCVRWAIEITGRSVHSSRPAEGIDALRIAEDLLRLLRDSGIAGNESHHLLGKSTLTCTMMRAGEGVNAVPGSARLTFDYRTLPGQVGKKIWLEVQSLAAGFATSLPTGARVVVEPPFIDDTLGMYVSASSEIVTSMQRVCDSFGMDRRPCGVAFGSDATKMTAAGIPSIIFGPGSIEQAHTANEFVSVAEVAKAAEMLAALARSL
jgi:acetylornithine deacetylase